MLKKLLYFGVLAVIILSLSSCESFKEVVMKKPQISGAFACDFSIKDEGKEISGDFTRYGLGLYEMKITSPETLAGLTLEYKDSGILCVFDDIELEIAKENINDTAYFEMIFCAIDDFAINTEAVLNSTENGMKYEGESPCGEFILYFDMESLDPTTIEFPQKNITVEILNYRM